MDLDSIISGVTKQVYLNRSQAIINLVNPNVCHVMAPRASGKTSIIGARLVHLNKVMPRSQILLYSDTFERLVNITWPAIQLFLQEELGLIEDVDYVVFKKPPEHFKKPYIVPRKFDRVVSFSDGLCLIMGCSFKDGSVNGISAQAAIIDETKYVREDRIKSQLYRALRGNFKRFGHLAEYRSVWSFTDKYQGDVRWIMKLRDQQNMKVVNAVLFLQLEVIRLQGKMKEAAAAQNKTWYYKLKNQVLTLEAKMLKVRKEMVFVCDALPFENMEALGEKFYRDQKRDCKSIYEYNTAVLNHDPNKVEHNFYPDLTDRRFYSSTNDVDPDRPLSIALDYQWRILPLVVGQRGVLGDADTSSFNIVRAMHTLYPSGLKEVVQMFCDTYKDHGCKVVQYVYDKTAVGKDPRGDSFRDIVVGVLEANRWAVDEVYIEQPDHDIKYEEMRTILQTDGAQSVMINRDTTKYLVKSLNGAGTLTGSGGRTQKDKRAEKNLNIPAEEGTDYSDAFDQLIWAGVKLDVLYVEMAGTGAVLKGN